MFVRSLGGYLVIFCSLCNSCFIKAPEGHFQDCEEDVEEETHEDDLTANEEQPTVPRKRDDEPALVTAILTTGIEDRKVRNMLADFRSKSDARLAANNAINNR